MFKYNRENWYWIVGDDEDHVYSSVIDETISVDDLAYEQWLEAGGVPTRIAANDMLLLRIQILEASVTERMIQEVAAGSSNVFAYGPHTGKTSAQVIAEIVAKKDALRELMA